MNLVGKIFTVLILIMSVFFGAITIAVYATHRNWRDVVMNDGTTPGKELGLKKQLEQKENRNQELRDQKAKLEGDLTAERKNAEQARSKLETELAVLKANHADLVAQDDALVKSERDAVAGMKTAHDTLAVLRSEVDRLRTDITQAQTQRDSSFKEVVRLTEENHAALAEVERLKERNVTVSADLAQAEAVLRHNKLSKDTPITDTPPEVEGLVLAVPQQDLIEISIGSDDGLRAGHKLQVVRMQGGRQHVRRPDRSRPDRAGQVGLQGRSQVSAEQRAAR